MVNCQLPNNNFVPIKSNFKPSRFPAQIRSRHKTKHIARRLRTNAWTESKPWHMLSTVIHWAVRRLGFTQTVTQTVLIWSMNLDPAGGFHPQNLTRGPYVCTGCGLLSSIGWDGKVLTGRLQIGAEEGWGAGEGRGEQMRVDKL